MLPSSRRYHWFLRIAAMLAVAWVWRLTTRMFGVALVELLAFVAPGAVLAIASAWFAEAFRSRRVDERRVWCAALIGGTVLPPFIALAVAFFSAVNRNGEVVTFVLGAWLAVAVGLVAGASSALHADWVRRRPVPRPTLVLIKRERSISRARRATALAAAADGWAARRTSTE